MVNAADVERSRASIVAPIGYLSVIYRAQLGPFRVTESKASRTFALTSPCNGFVTLDVCMERRHFGCMLIYKILTAEQWAGLDATGTFNGAPIDVADGYIHTSTAAQAQETADKHFAGVDGLMLAALNPDTYGDDLVWEPSRGGQDFPHIYRRPLLRSEVVWVRPMPVMDGRHVLDLT